MTETTELLKDDGGNVVKVLTGSSCDVEFTFKDMQKPPEPINKVGILTLTATLTKESDGSVANGRDDQNVMDANNGVVSDDGVLTLGLQPADTGDRAKLLVKWTWNDGDQVRTGKAARLLVVVE